MVAMVVSSQHSAIFSAISEKSQEWWLRLNAQYAVRYLPVQQHAISTLRRASVKAQGGNHPLSRGHTYYFDFGVKAKALGSGGLYFVIMHLYFGAETLSERERKRLSIEL
jgi:hypothetical protein